MGFELHAFESRGALAEALAGKVAAVLSGAVAERGVGLLAVSGGTTPAGFFAALARQPIDWSRIVVTLIDERFVPATSERSNARLVSEKLLAGPASAARFVPLYSEAAGVEDAAHLADARLAALPWPLDAAILGMGTDGHTASFFPDAANLAVLTDPASTETVAAVHAASGVEPRLTLTIGPIIAARLLVLHIEGAEKRAVLDRALAEDATERLPIRRVFDHAQRPIEVFWAE